jgi:transposase InsO family protein
MKGLYSGVTMKLRYLWPKGFQDRIISLSLEGRKRLSWMDWYLSHGKNARATCRHFGISPDTFYLWKGKFNPGSLITLEDNKATRRPKHTRKPTTSIETINKVVDIRRLDPEKSKYEICEELKRDGVIIGTSTIQRIINHHPTLANSQHVKKIRSHHKRAIARIKAAKELREKEPGSLVQVDTKHLYILGKRFYVFAAVDSFSRLGFISAFETGSSLSGSLFLQELINYFPFKIKAVQTDNGGEYLLNFHKTCQDKNIPHYFTDPYCPKQNGRAERFIQTATYEFFNWQEDLLPNINQLKEKCQIFNQKYNNYRFHRSLGYNTPREYLALKQVYVI